MCERLGQDRRVWVYAGDGSGVGACGVLVWGFMALGKTVYSILRMGRKRRRLAEAESVFSGARRTCTWD